MERGHLGPHGTLNMAQSNPLDFVRAQPAGEFVANIKPLPSEPTAKDVPGGADVVTDLRGGKWAVTYKPEASGNVRTLVPQLIRAWSVEHGTEG
jgi:hypothetical protein